MKHSLIHNQTYDCILYIYTDCDFVEAYRHLKKRIERRMKEKVIDDPRTIAMHDHCCNGIYYHISFDGEKFKMLWLRSTKEFEKNIGIVAHEIVHYATDALHGERNLNLTIETQEAYAYFIGSTIKRVLSVIK